jgi:hypothetical protein
MRELNSPEKLCLWRFSTILLIYCIFSILIVLGCRGPTYGEEKSILLGFTKAEESDAVAEGWEMIGYFRTAENDMSVMKGAMGTVLRVKSLGSASALLKRPEVDLGELPILTWRWKVDRVVGMAIETKKDRNDSAARIRVIFGRGGEKSPEVAPEWEELLESLGIKGLAREPSGFKIDYIWANRLRRDEVLDYPGARNHKVIVVRSGRERVNQWISEERNLVEDYERLFMGAPPGLVGIVVLTDTDDTNEGVEAWYTDIVLRSE